MNKVAVIIPFYKDTLSDYEKIALQQCQQILPNHTKIAIKPKSLTLPADAGIISLTDAVSFDDNYFKSLAGYNRLMLSAEFYKQFLNYEYILIYQMDTFIFRDELNQWCSQDWDYIGAPWIHKTYHKSAAGLAFYKAKKAIMHALGIPSKHIFEGKVGNGGFSLRRVKKFHELCISMKPTIDFYLSQTGHIYNEDVFWSIEVNRESKQMNVPDVDTALKFAFEVPPLKAHHYNKANLPFGCHDWDKYADFWRPIFKLYNYHI
jgi:hypothetical protein